MKHLIYPVIIFLTITSGNNNATASDKTSVPICKQKHSVTSYIQGNDLVGEWQLTLSFYDANGNYKIEETEKKNATLNAKDYLKLNGDGTCLFYTNKLKGRYEIKTRSSGKKNLYIYDKDNNKENRGEIISVSKTELILLSPGGAFSIYKKV